MHVNHLFCTKYALKKVLTSNTHLLLLVTWANKYQKSRL